MNVLQLLTHLQRVRGGIYGDDMIVRLVQDNKHVFNRPGLRPNAIDCIDKAVVTQSKRIFGSYNAFVATLEVVASTNYWDKFPRTPKAPDATTESQALRQVFDIYVKSVLQQHYMSEYAAELGIR